MDGQQSPPIKKVGRPRTVNVKLPLFAGDEAGKYPRNAQRPETRGDCCPSEAGGNHARPCPWASCKFHLALDVARNGSLKINWPANTLDGVVDNIGAMKETCALDVADRGEMTLEDIGALLNVTRERIRQMEAKLFQKLRTSKATARAVGEDVWSADGMSLENPDPDFDPEFEPEENDYLAALFPGLRAGQGDETPPDDLFEL